jgi:hypothetical protein
VSSVANGLQKDTDDTSAEIAVRNKRLFALKKEIEAKQAESDQLEEIYAASAATGTADQLLR